MYEIGERLSLQGSGRPQIHNIIYYLPRGFSGECNICCIGCSINGISGCKRRYGNGHWDSFKGSVRYL